MSFLIQQKPLDPMVTGLKPKSTIHCFFVNFEIDGTVSVIVSNAVPDEDGRAPA
jgi:hypothetical protein